MTAVEITSDILSHVTAEIAQAELDRRAKPKTERGKAENRWAAQLWAPQLKEIAGGSAATVTVERTKVTTVTSKPKPATTRKPVSLAKPSPAKPFDGKVKALTPVTSTTTLPDVSVGVANLAEAIKAIEAPTKTRSILPTLKCVAVQAAGESVTLTTTDLDCTMQVTVPAKVSVEGAVAIPLAELKALLPTAKKNQIGDVRLRSNADEGTVEVTGGNGSSTIHFTDVSQFPTTTVVTPDASAIINLDLDAIGSVVGCANTDDTRPVLNAVFFDGNVVAATDSYRLAECDSPTMTVETRMLVPATFLKGLVKRGQRAVAVANDLDLLVTDESGMVMVCRLIAGEFPNYKALFPTDADKLVSFDADEMTAALTAHLARKPSSTTPVRFGKGAGKVPVRITEADRFDATIEVKGECPVEMGFNPRYLRDFIAGGFDQLHVVNALKPARAEVTDEAGRKHRRLLMPVRLS